MIILPGCIFRGVYVRPGDGLAKVQRDARMDIASLRGCISLHRTREHAILR
jgi:hypothetical protein